MKRLILAVVLLFGPATAFAQPADNAKPAPPPDDAPSDTGAPEEPPPVPAPTPMAAPTPDPIPAPEVEAEPTVTAAVANDDDQTPSLLTAGFKGGVNAGTQSGSGATDPSTHFGMCLGVFLKYELSSALSVHTEVLMSDKGADYLDMVGNEADEAILYVELPVFARYDYPVGSRLTAFGFGGPSVAYIIDSKRTMKGDLNPIDVAIAAGAGLDIDVGKRIIAVDVRFSQGLLNVLDNGTDNTIRNRLISLYAGVTL
jgi:opacity protein-like surface antigen